MRSSSNLDGSEQAFEITVALTRIWQDLQGRDSQLQGMLHNTYDPKAKLFLIYRGEA